MSRITTHGRESWTAQSRPGRMDPRIRIQPMDAEPVWLDKYGKAIGLAIMVVASVVFFGGMV